MRFAAFRPRGKFYLLGLGVVWLGLVSVKECVAQAFAHPDARAVATAKYETLKTRVMGGDLTVDWTEFRSAAAAAGYSSYDWNQARQRILKNLDAGNLAAARSGAQAVIARNLADPEGHLLAMTVYRQMGDDQAVARERAIVEVIVKSIMASGDGLSAQHAWTTVSANEEQFIVNMVLDADTESQSLIRRDGFNYDRMTVRGEDGTERVLWFRSNSGMPVALAVADLPRR